MVSDMVKLVLIHQWQTSQIRGRGTNSLEIDAVNQEWGNKSLSFGGSSEDIARDDRSEFFQNEYQYNGDKPLEWRRKNI